MGPMFRGGPRNDDQGQPGANPSAHPQHLLQRQLTIGRRQTATRRGSLLARAALSILRAFSGARGCT